MTGQNQRSAIFDPRYEILATIGRGGMGIVYKALDRVEGKVVALKTLHAPEPSPATTLSAPDRETDGIELRRFEREIRALGNLHHEGIVQLHDVGQRRGQTYFTMEFLSGVPLQAFLTRPLPGQKEIEWLLRVGLRVLDALEHLHRSGFVHRDLKPSNIMVLFPRELSTDESTRETGSPGKSAGNPAGNPADLDSLVTELEPRIKVLDLGLVRTRDAQLAPGRPAAGTPLYMAPEQMDPTAGPDARSDLYSLGVILYQLITRQLPHPTVASVLQGKAPIPPATINPACTSVLSGAILRLLDPRPHRRFASALDFSRHLTSVLQGTEPEESESPAPRLVAPSFVGRMETQKILGDGLAMAAGGKGQFLLVGGARGTGKTWLLDRSGLKPRAVLEFGLTYYQGRYTAGGALHQGLGEVVLGMILDLAAEVDLEGLPDLLGPWGGGLLDALGIDSIPAIRALWPAPTDGVSPEILTDQVVEAGVALFRASAREGKLLLLDDLHLGDELDIEILSRVTRCLRELPLLIVATCRQEMADTNRALRRWREEFTSTGGDARSRHLHLAPFNDGEAGQMARSMLSPQADLDPPLLTELLDRTAGVPGALESCVQDLWYRGRIRPSEGRWCRVPDPPSTDQPSGLEPDPTTGLEPLDEKIILAASVLGEHFEPEALLGLLYPVDPPTESSGSRRKHEEAIIGRLHALVARGLLSQGSTGYTFSRAAQREQVETLLPARRRRELHLRAAGDLVAEGGEASADHWDTIAHHYVQAGLPEKALKFHLQSARRAAGRYANRRGIASFRAALALMEPEARGAVARELGRLHARIGEYGAALECFYSTSGEPEVDSPSLLDEVGRIHLLKGDLKPARECFERALVLAGDDPGLLLTAHHRLGGVRFEEGDVAEAENHYRASLELARTVGNLGAMGVSHSGLGLISKRTETPASAARHFREAIRYAEAASDPLQAATALNNLGNIHRAQGEDEKAVECFRRSIVLREQIGDRKGLGICFSNLSLVLARRGELGSALDAVARALTIFEEVGNQKGVLIVTCNAGSFRFLLGDFKAARECFLRTRVLAERSGDRRALSDALLCLGRLENTRGEYGEAEGFLREGLRALGDQRDADLHSGILAELARARFYLDDLEGAIDAVREGLEEAPDPGGSSRSVLLAMASEIELSRDDPEAAVRKAREALETLSPGGARFEIGLAHRHLGRAYRALGPDWVDRAEKHLDEALSIFEKMGSEFESAVTMAEIGDLWSALGEVDEAARYYQQAGEAPALANVPSQREKLRERIRSLGEEP